MIIQLTRKEQLIIAQKIIDLEQLYEKSVLVHKFVIRVNLYDTESIAVSFADLNNNIKTNAIPLILDYYKEENIVQKQYYINIPNSVLKKAGNKLASIMILDNYSAEEVDKKIRITTSDFNFTVQQNNLNEDFDPIDQQIADSLQSQVNDNKANIETNKENIDKVQAQADETSLLIGGLNTRVNDNHENLQAQELQIQSNANEINDIEQSIRNDLTELEYNNENFKFTKFYRDGRKEEFVASGGGGGGSGGLGYDFIDFTVDDWIEDTVNNTWTLIIPNTETGFSDDNYVAVLEILDDSTNTYYSSVEEFKRNADGSLSIYNSVEPYAGRFVIPISGKAVGVMTVDTIHNLPNIGNQYTIYVVKSDNASYRYDNTDNKYYCISGSNAFNISIIDGNA